MQRQEVESSNIKAIGYDSNTNILEVEFKDFSIYHYMNVPANVYQSFLNASSVGKYFHQYIKSSYSFIKIT